MTSLLSNRTIPKLLEDTVSNDARSPTVKLEG
jgi:hypothetical protein